MRDGRGDEVVIVEGEQVVVARVELPPGGEEELLVTGEAPTAGGGFAGEAAGQGVPLPVAEPGGGVGGAPREGAEQEEPVCHREVAEAVTGRAEGGRGTEEVAEAGHGVVSRPVVDT